MWRTVNSLVILILLFTLSGCASGLKKRAAFDLNCPEDQLTMINIGFNTTGVSGCDKKATYVREGWVWYLNSPRTEIK